MATTRAFLGAALLALAATFTTPVSAQGRHVIDGRAWMNSSYDERVAFLAGAANMMALERAYAQRHGKPTSEMTLGAEKALGDLPLKEIASRVTRWYEANPANLDAPVLGIIWREMVRPQIAAK